MAISALFPVYMAAMLDSIGSYMMTPLLPLLVISMNGTAAQSGLIFSLYNLMSCLGTPILGAVGDRIGRGKVLLFALAMTGFALLGFGYSWNLAQLAAFRVVHGFFAGTVSVCQAIVADFTSKEERPGKLALVMACFGTGLVIGPAVASLVIMAFGHGSYGMHVLCSIAASLTFGNFFVGLFTVRKLVNKADDDSTKESTEISAESNAVSLRDVFMTREFGILFLMIFFANVALGMWQGSISLFYTDVFGSGPSQVSLVCCLAGLGMMFFQGLLTKPAVKLLGRHKCIVMGSCLRAGCLVFLTLEATPLRELLSPVRPLIKWFLPLLHAGAGAFIDPCTLSMVSDRAPPASSGLVLGAFQATGLLGQFVGPLLGGILYCFHIWYMPMTAAACVAMLIPLVPLLPKQPDGAVPAVGGTVRVLSSGRIGQVLCHDPTDPSLTYKVQFGDGQMPEVDWYSACSVVGLAAVDSEKSLDKPLLADCGKDEVGDHPRTTSKESVASVVLKRMASKDIDFVGHV